ncbi:magnetosome protein Mad26-2 [Candidatus Magnetomorum sp. HK-1]|nr:magnetosome protein Mad26-2 [Candidatus Magnetomorum sp. HK-1]
MDDLKNSPAEISKFIKDVMSADSNTEEQLIIDLEEIAKKKVALKKQNESLRQKKELLEEEVSSMNQSINVLNESIEESENRNTEMVKQVGNLQIDNEKLISDINNIKATNKATSIDFENTQHVIETLTNELEEFENERSIAMERINLMRNAIKSIATEKDRKLPKLKQYDGMLKRAYTIFQETESRMELSLKLKDVP